MMWVKQWKLDVKELEQQVRDIKVRLRRDWGLYSKDISVKRCLNLTIKI